MRLSPLWLLVSSFTVAASASNYGSSAPGRACPIDSVGIFKSCDCPVGTQFQISTTYAMLGVSAKDFNQYTSSFYDIAWQGITEIKTNGPDYQAGSTRSYTSTSDVANATFIEKLDSYQSTDDGSYLVRYSQYNVPIMYADGKGQFGGYWESLHAEYAAEYQTQLHWTLYACFTGTPFNFGEGRIAALDGLMNTMSKAGLVKGNTTAYYYTQSF